MYNVSFVTQFRLDLATPHILDRTEFPFHFFVNSKKNNLNIHSVEYKTAVTHLVAEKGWNICLPKYFFFFTLMSMTYFVSFFRFSMFCCWYKMSLSNLHLTLWILNIYKLLLHLLSIKFVIMQAYITYCFTISRLYWPINDSTQLLFKVLPRICKLKWQESET